MHMWAIMFAREECLLSFWKSRLLMAKHPDWRHLRVLKFQVKSVNKNQKLRKFVFIKGLAAKVRLAVFKNAIQQQLSTKYTAKINFVSSGT